MSQPPVPSRRSVFFPRPRPISHSRETQTATTPSVCGSGGFTRSTHSRLLLSSADKKPQKSSFYWFTSKWTSVFCVFLELMYDRYGTQTTCVMGWQMVFSTIGTQHPEIRGMDDWPWKTVALHGSLHTGCKIRSRFSTPRERSRERHEVMDRVLRFFFCFTVNEMWNVDLELGQRCSWVLLMRSLTGKKGYRYMTSRTNDRI